MTQMRHWAASLLIPVVLLPTSQAAELCKPVGKRDRADVAREYGRDPAGVVQKATEVLHNQFKAHNLNEPNQIYKDNSDLRIQMSIMINYFSLNHWVDKLSVITKPQKLSSHSQQEWGYVFSSWMRVRYLATVKELVREPEIFQVFREPAFAQIKDFVVQKPATLVVTGYKRFACETDLDQRTYDCSKNYVLIDTQLSPKVMCSNKKLASQAHFKYLVDVTKGRYRVADVEMNGARLFQDAYLDLEAMTKSQANAEETLTKIKTWSFLPMGPVNDDELKAFQRAMTPSAQIAPKKASGRMPASTK
jgi:hypothetical protein